MLAHLSGFLRLPLAVKPGCFAAITTAAGEIAGYGHASLHPERKLLHKDGLAVA